jgi:hypothetical protein
MIDRYLHASHYDRHAEEYAHEVANERAAPSWGRVLDDCHVRSPLSAGIASESRTRGYSFRSCVRSGRQAGCALFKPFGPPKWNQRGTKLLWIYHGKSNRECAERIAEEAMSLFATVTIVLEVVFWVALLSVMFAFVAALAKGAIEDIRDHKRIVAARNARGIAPPSAQWERAIRTRQMRNQ